MQTLSQRRQALISCALLGVLAPFAASAEKYPDHPIRIVNIFPAGGPSDVAARILAQQLTESLGQSVIVESKPGASGMIAAAYVASQPKDGYTLLLANNQTNSNSLVYAKMSYKMSDFAPVSLIMKTVNAMVVPTSLPVNNVREFVDYAKKRPGELNYAILGLGGSPHVNGKMLEKAGDITMTPLSYGGAAPAVQDIMAGRIQAMFVTTSGALAYQASGRAKILAITGAERIDSAPELPTFKEQGFDVVSYSWFGLLVPAGTPADRIELLSKAVAKAVASPEYQQKTKEGGNIPASSTPPQMKEFMRQDFATWEAILKPLHLQLD
jgi:tripartite-type tricarboxylate transporter receptor subunit TctC